MRLPRCLPLLALLALLPLWFSACVPARTEGPSRQEQLEQARRDMLNRQQLNRRPPVNTSRNLYEGSLWQGAASWGNLLRDHRARYEGDLLTVTNMQGIISVPEPEPEPAEEEQANGENGQPQDPLLRFLEEQRRLRREIDREQNDILRSINNIEVEVVDVLPNGNLRVRGAHPPIYRDRNRVKYVVTLQGVVRPAEVDANNTVTADKLSKAEYRIRRLIKRSTLPQFASSAARAGGAEREAALLDRFADFLTEPGIGSRNTPGNQR